jgi:hypothetical protein
MCEKLGRDPLEAAMGEIYGLYSTSEGLVRYVGQTEYSARKRLDLIITKALDREPGALYDWVRDAWRTEHEIRAYVLQDEVIPADLEMFEAYWIEQFSGLLNVKPPADPARSTTEIGQRIHETIHAQIRGQAAASD